MFTYNIFYHILYLSPLFLDHSHLKLHVLSFCLSVSPSLSRSKTYKTVIKQERRRKETWVRKMKHGVMCLCTFDFVMLGYYSFYFYFFRNETQLHHFPFLFPPCTSYSTPHFQPYHLFFSQIHSLCLLFFNWCVCVSKFVASEQEVIKLILRHFYFFLLLNTSNWLI